MLSFRNFSCNISENSKRNSSKNIPRVSPETFWKNPSGIHAEITSRIFFLGAPAQKISERMEGIPGELSEVIFERTHDDASKDS